VNISAAELSNAFSQAAVLEALSLMGKFFSSMGGKYMPFLLFSSTIALF